MSPSFELDKKIQEWLKWDKNEHTKTEIEKLVKSKKYDDLKGVLLKRLSFGTAGLRGKMAAGYSCMNDLVIIQTGQGLLKYLEKTEQKMLQSNGIVLGFDGRHNSKRFPNPEEGKSALDLSIKTANENKSTIILANDPDADSTGEWKVFTGNELGALFGWWILHCFKIKNPNVQIDETYMISSTVSSMILKTMSKKEGFKFEETLTGFKWMGNKSIELINQGKKVLYAFEESIGYMCGTAVLDKDGVSAASVFATMASFLYNINETVTEKLENIYNTYGQHLSLQSYYICHDPVVIGNIFKRIRNYSNTNKYPSGVLNNKYKIIAVRDLTTGYDDNQPDKKAVLPVDSKNHMITFNFENGLVCTLRTSGTEPKIKYYTELCASPEIIDINQIKETLNEMVLAICKELLEPEKNELISKCN
ncbi:unnamed protein product [Brassicogethes aeneus]|uniref:Phosphoglucomutase-2 n=1 Tax=Brassicogethes aeneus TaxID=1431903 RepID=A0A9P0B2H6_BRAAE|nr:unnamed protein product [Brassicogethes aeneus]